MYMYIYLFKTVPRIVDKILEIFTLPDMFFYIFQNLTS